MAVGVLMARLQLDRRQAFELLRARARTERRKVGEVASDLLQAMDQLASWAAFQSTLSHPPRKL